jgi:hypothetical protein
MRETKTIIKPLPDESRTIDERIKQHMQDIATFGEVEAVRKRKNEGTLVCYEEVLQDKIPS